SAPSKIAVPSRLRIDRAQFERGRWLRTDAADAIVLVGCGRVRGEQEIAIVDPEACTRCPEDGVGEIWLRGPSVAAGYFEYPEDTQVTFAARIAGEDDLYLRTGDLGFVADGEVFITGRWKDILVVRARKHHAEDVERTVERASDVLRPGCGVAFSLEPPP